MSDRRILIRLKPIKRHERQYLPDEMKVLFFLLKRQGWVPEDIAADCYKKYPSLFDIYDKI